MRYNVNACPDIGNGAFRPPAITAKLSDALKKALDAPDFKDQIAKVGGELFLGGNAEAVSFIQIQFDRMGKIIREGNIRPE